MTNDQIAESLGNKVFALETNLYTLTRNVGRWGALIGNGATLEAEVELHSKIEDILQSMQVSLEQLKELKIQIVDIKEI